MKTFSFFILVIASFSGLSSGSDEVNLCERFLDSETYWPSYVDSNVFFKCNGPNRHAYICPPNTLFSFPCQVCVWPRDWTQPPPVNSISPNRPVCIVDGTTSTTSNSLPTTMSSTITSTETTESTTSTESTTISTTIATTESTTTTVQTTESTTLESTPSIPTSTEPEVELDVNFCLVFPGSLVYWPNFSEANSFFKCVGASRFLMRCPATLLFSFGCQVCVWPWDWRQPPPVNEINTNLPPCIVGESTQTSTSTSTTTTSTTTEEPETTAEETTTEPEGSGEDTTASTDETDEPTDETDETDEPTDETDETNEPTDETEETSDETTTESGQVTDDETTSEVTETEPPVEETDEPATDTTSGPTPPPVETSSDPTPPDATDEPPVGETDEPDSETTSGPTPPEVEETTDPSPPEVTDSTEGTEEENLTQDQEIPEFTTPAAVEEDSWNWRWII